jgi:putative transposase
MITLRIASRDYRRVDERGISPSGDMGESLGIMAQILNEVDEFTRMALGCRVAPSIGARDVADELDELFGIHGRPQVIRSDNGREFVAASLLEFLAAHEVRPVFIEKGRPQQNAFVERFNGTMRDEKLNGEEFDSALEARVVLHAWIREYNQLRPHPGLGMKTPRQFADEWSKGRA